MDEQSSSDLSPTVSDETSIFSDGLFRTPATQVRKATIDDIDEVLRRARDFHSHSIYRNTSFNVEAVRGVITSLVDQGGIFLNDQDGFIAGTLVPLFFDPSCIIATELSWWAPGRGGRELRDAFEEWGRQSGASVVQFSAQADDQFDKVHENMNKNGFALTELSYTKRL